MRMPLDDRERPGVGRLTCLIFLMIIELLLITAMHDRSISDFVYQGF